MKDDNENELLEAGEDPMAEVSTTPRISELADELKRSSIIYSSTNRAWMADATRYCRWDGQSIDGKKWEKNLGKAAFPWDGASDTRLPLADEVINTLVDLDVTSWFRANLKVAPQNSQDADQGSAANTLMDWAVNARMHTELPREVELISQYKWTYGWAGAHITWQQQQGQKRVTLTTNQLAEMAQKAQPGSILADIPSMIANPEAEDQLAEIFQATFNHLKKRRALKAVRELRSTGECSFPVPAKVRNQPCIVALCPYDELVIPPETTDVQSARVIFRRCRMSQIEIMQNVLANGWDPKWAEAVIETSGRTGSWVDAFATGTHATGTGNAGYENAYLCEVVYAYQKATDDDDVPGVWCTVFSPQVLDQWATFDLIDYNHGQYPFVIWRAEIPHRKIIDSRGVPEIAATWQQEAKVQRDSITDYTSLATLPPILVPKTRAGNLKLGPAVQVPVMRPNEVSFMQPPAREPGVAFQLLELIEAMTDRYFGRPTEKVPPMVSQMRQQRHVNNWLHGWTEVMRQVLSLTIQYLSPDEVARIVGMQIPLDADMEDFDLVLRFNVQELNSDLVTEKLKTIVQMIAPADQAGTIDWSKFVPLMLRMVDPAIASEITMNKASAAQKMFGETEQELALMVLGNPPKLRENDPTAETRMQFAQQIIQSNPKYQAALQGDPMFKGAVAKYFENLQFSVQQKQNAMTGRLGVDPSAQPMTPQV